MCRPVTCNTCGKTTWTGCGDHIDQVKATIPADEWCGGHGDSARPTVNPGSGLFKIFGR